MDTSVDEYKSQCGQLSAYLWGRWESIIKRWEQSHLTNEAHSTQEGTDQLRSLLYQLTQRITYGPEAHERVDHPDQYGLHHWLEGYSLTEVITQLTNFYDSIDQAILQFQAQYPQTQPQVIRQAFRQAGSLFNEGITRSILHLDQKPFNTATK